MRQRTLSVIELFRLFPNEQAARLWFEEIRWNDYGRICPNHDCKFLTKRAVSRTTSLHRIGALTVEATFQCGRTR